MLYFNRIDISEGTDIKKTSTTKECDIYHYSYFIDYSFKFQPNVCNRCHDLILMSMNLSDIAILNIKNCNYRCIISLISKNEAINVIQNADLTEKNQNIIMYTNLSSCIKIDKEILTFGNTEI